LSDLFVTSLSASLNAMYSPGKAKGIGIRGNCLSTAVVAAASGKQCAMNGSSCKVYSARRRSVVLLGGHQLIKEAVHGVGLFKAFGRYPY